MYFNLYGHKIYIISRPKLGIIPHLGVLIGDDLVWHCTPERGTHAATPEEFAQGFDVTIVREVPAHMYEFIMQRISWIRANPHRYDVLLFNCIHFVNWLTAERQQSIPKEMAINQAPQPIF